MAANGEAISSLLLRVYRAMTEEMTPASNVEEELSRVFFIFPFWCNLLCAIEIKSSINSSSAHPSQGNRGAFAHVVSPGGVGFAVLSLPRGLGISVPRGDPQAFDTSVKATTSWEKHVRGQLNTISVLRIYLLLANRSRARRHKK